MIRTFFVDDDELLLDGLKNIIDWGNYGFQLVGEAHDGNDAFEKIKKLAPDVVFIDIVMPGMTGLELIKKLQNGKAKYDFIIMSGHAEFSYAKEACRLGAVDYLLKPVDEEVLEEILDRLQKKYLIMKNKDYIIRTAVIPEEISHTFKLVLDYIHANYNSQLHLYDIADKYHFNANYISQLFKQESGISFSEYLTQYRLDKAEQMLKVTTLPVKSVCHNVGITDYFYFNKLFKKYKGVTPGSFRT